MEERGRPSKLLLDSPANPRLRAAAALRDRSERDRTGRTIVDGGRELRRALEAGLIVETAFVCPALVRGPDARAALDLLDQARVEIVTVSERALAKVAFGDRLEGLVAVLRIPALGLEELRLPPAPLLVVLEAVEKPGNLGAVLRSADGAGADAVLAASPRTDAYNPNVIRASLGTAFTVRMAAAPAVTVVDWLRAREIRLVAARVDGRRAPWDVDLRGPVAIVLGAEDDGLTDLWRGDDVEAVRLPMLGAADSLNVSVAAAVLLYEARRQRGQSSKPD